MGQVHAVMHFSLGKMVWQYDVFPLMEKLVGTMKWIEVVQY